MLTCCVLTLPFLCCAEMWLSNMTNFPLGSQEASEALEAYQCETVSQTFWWFTSRSAAKSRLVSPQVNNWVAFKLLAWSFRWWKWFFPKRESLYCFYVMASSTSNSRLFCHLGQSRLPVCQSCKQERQHIIINRYGVESGICCSWSLQGNLCKHVIKVNMICENLQGCQRLLCFHSHHHETKLLLWLCAWFVVGDRIAETKAIPVRMFCSAFIPDNTSRWSVLNLFRLYHLHCSS